jgi:hypothetical protein
MFIAAIAIVETAHANWLYLNPGFGFYGYRDSYGVLRAWQADAARYDQRTRDFQVEIHGHWLSIGRDVEQLTDFR